MLCFLVMSIMNRRHVLTGVGAAAVVALAGCTADEGETDDSDDGGNPVDENGDDGGSDDSTNDESSGDIVTFESYELQEVEFDCTSEVTFPTGQEQMLRAGPTVVDVGGAFHFEEGDAVYPEFVGIEQDADAEEITVTTSFTDEPVDGHDEFGDQIERDDLSSPSECLDERDYARTYFYAMIPVAEGDEIPEGVEVIWDVEYPDGSVETIDTVVF